MTVEPRAVKAAVDYRAILAAARDDLQRAMDEQSDDLHADIERVLAEIDQALGTRTSERHQGARTVGRVIGDGDYGGVEGADGRIYSDADPGL